MKSIFFINISFYLIVISQSISLHRISTDQAESRTSSSTNHRTTADSSASSSELEISYPSQLNALDNLRHRDLKDIISSTKVRRSLPSYQQNHRLGLLEFPPRVGVLLRHGEASTLLQLALAPDMSTYDALNQARIRYSFLNPDSLFNPYILTLQYNHGKTCAEIMSAAAEEAVWVVKVTDRADEVLHEGTCIPKRRNLIMRPGYNIEVYKS